MSALRALRKEKNTSSRLVHRARCEVLSPRSARAQHEQPSSQRGPTLSALHCTVGASPAAAPRRRLTFSARPISRVSLTQCRVAVGVNVRLRVMFPAGCATMCTLHRLSAWPMPSSWSTPSSKHVLAVVMPGLLSSATVTMRREERQRIPRLVGLREQGNVVVRDKFDDDKARRTFATKDASRAKHCW